MLAVHKSTWHTVLGMQYTLNVCQIRPFIGNEESFRKSVTVVLRRIQFCVGPPWPIFEFLEKYFHSKISYVFRWTSWINNTGAQSKSSKILEVQVYSSTAFCLKVLYAIFDAYCRQSLHAIFDDRICKNGGYCCCCWLLYSSVAGVYYSCSHLAV